jgi:hypothetical protein
MKFLTRILIFWLTPQGVGRKAGRLSVDLGWELALYSVIMPIEGGVFIG